MGGCGNPAVRARVRRKEWKEAVTARPSRKSGEGLSSGASRASCEVHVKCLAADEVDAG